MPQLSDRQIEQIASVVFAANRAYCLTLGDSSFGEWESAPEWQRGTIIDGIRKLIENRDITSEQSHESWMQFKLNDGWKYGPVKDPAKKEHPCLVPYSELPKEQQTKDHLFRAVALTLLSQL